MPRSNDRGLKSTRLLALFPDDLNARYFAEVLDVYINDPLDIAVCSVYSPEQVPPNVHFRNKLALDTAPPKVGTPIITAGYGDMTLQVETSDSMSRAAIEYRLVYRHGTITDIFPAGHKSLRLGPSFQIDVPISSGMSGGPVISKRYGDAVVVCGINTSDISVETGGSASGIRAIAQMLWPSMAIVVKQVEVDGMSGPVRLIELLRRGFIEDHGKAQDHIYGIPGPDSKQFSMAWR